MCPYQKLNPTDPNQISICEYTKEFCTLCVLGNMKTLKEAEEALEENNIINNKMEDKNNE